jgi:uncharacterized protein (TIGR03066 family)
MFHHRWTPEVIELGSKVQNIMKLSSRLARLKLQKMQANEPTPGNEKTGKVALRNWVALVVCLLFAAVGTGVALKFFVWDKLPPALIGKWEVQDGPMQGGTFEFTRDGTLAIRVTDGKQIQARARVEGKTLVQTTQDPAGLREETRKSTIQELTPNTLVLELERGAVLRMARAK